MSLQVCYCCGWSKVTTYQGLRIHQGRMGCTPKGVRVAEPQQQYMWGHVGPPEVQMDLKVDIWSSYKLAETKVSYSDQSLQVCHCGWSKMTTYQGLRIHQGKMGCTAKGMRIPKNEPFNWEDEADRNKYPQPKRTLPEAPWMSSRRDSAATTPRMKEEYKSSLVVPPHSYHTAAKSYPAQEKLSTHPKVREQPTAASLRKNRKHQLVPQGSFSGDMGSVWSVGSRNDHAAAFRIKEEPESSFAAPDVSLRSGPEMACRRDSFPDVQAYRETPTAPAVRPKERGRRDQTRSQGLVREHPPITHSQPDVRPKEKQKDWTFSRGNRSDRERWSSPPVVLPEKKDPPLLKMNKVKSDAGFVDEIQSNLRENMLREEPRDRKRPVKTAHLANLPVQRSSAPTCQQPAVQLEAEDKEGRGSQVDRSVREQPSAPAVVLPKKKEAPVIVAKSLLLDEIQDMLLRKNRMREENRDIKAQELDSENVSVSPRINSPAAMSEEKKPSVTPQAEKPKSLPSPSVVRSKKKGLPLLKMTQEGADPETGKEMYNNVQENKMIVEKLSNINEPVELSHERIDPPKEASFREEIKSPSPPQRTTPKSVHQPQDLSAAEQANRSVTKHSNAPPVVPPKRKGSTLFKIVKHTRSTPTKITTAEAQVSQEEHKVSSHKPSQSGSLTGMKVKELARMFSVPTAQEKALRPKEETREGHGLSQKRLLVHRFSAIAAQKTTEERKEELKTEKDVTGATIPFTATTTASKKEDPPSSCETTGMKVKELAWMFSAQEEAVRPNHKPSQVKVLAQRVFSTQGATGQAKEKGGEKEKPAQWTADSGCVAVKKNPAASATSQEEPRSLCESTQLSGFSAGSKVKDLVRMFSAAAVPEKAAWTKEKQNQSEMSDMDGKCPKVMKTVEEFSSSSLRST